MELINKKHPMIGIGLNVSPYISFQHRGKIYFSKSAVNSYSINENLKVHFLRDGMIWYILFDDNKDGFNVKMRTDRGKNHAIVHALSFCSMFLLSTKQKPIVAYFIQESDKKHNGKRLLEILTHKPITKIGKD